MMRAAAVKWLSTNTRESTDTPTGLAYLLKHFLSIFCV